MFREAAKAEGGDQAVTHCPAGDALAHLDDLSGNLAAGGERALRLQLIFVLDDEDVGKVDGASAHPDQQFALSERWTGNIAEH